VGDSPRVTQLFWTLSISSALIVALIPGLFAPLPLAHAQSTVMVSETLGSGNFSGAPGYSPDRITVVIGVNNTISWTNNDVGHNHTVTSMIIPTGAAPFNSGNMVKNAVYTVTLTVPGLYRYGCSYHPWMGGIIDVVAPVSSSAAGSSISGFPLVYLAAILVVVAVVVVAAVRLRPRSRRDQAP
jgi:plastocyanin